MVEQKDDFFVGINNPLDVRRNVLECSREMIQTLQTHEKIKKLREAKIKRTLQLKTVIRELDLLFSKLRTALPKTHLRAKVTEPKQRLKIKPSNIKEMNEFEQLETQLSTKEQNIRQMQTELKIKEEDIEKLKKS